MKSSDGVCEFFEFNRCANDISKDQNISHRTLQCRRILCCWKKHQLKWIAQCTTVYILYDDSRVQIRYLPYYVCTIFRRNLYKTLFCPWNRASTRLSVNSCLCSQNLLVRHNSNIEKIGKCQEFHSAKYRTYQNSRCECILIYLFCVHFTYQSIRSSLQRSHAKKRINENVNYSICFN